MECLSHTSIYFLFSPSATYVCCRDLAAMGPRQLGRREHTTKRTTKPPSGSIIPNPELAVVSEGAKD